MRKKKAIICIVVSMFALTIAKTSNIAEASRVGSAYKPAYYQEIVDYALQQEEKILAENVAQKLKEAQKNKIEYVIKKGDTLGAIARRKSIPVEKLIEMNNISNPHLISKGQKLVLEMPEIKEHTLLYGETIWDLSTRYGADWREILEYNNVSDPTGLQPETTVLIPNPTRDYGPTHVHRVAMASREVIPSRSQVDNRSTAPSFSWPLEGEITSIFGPRQGRLHEGLDIAAPFGTAIRAIADGEVVASRWGSGYGYYVAIYHGGGWETRYGHASKLLVSKGQFIEKGQPIAQVGSTGNSTGPHVHLEIIKDGEKLDPLNFLSR